MLLWVVKASAAIIYISISFSMITAKRFCDSGWQYHNVSQTCLRVVHYRDYFSNANGHCKSYSGGPHKMTPGHLVYILNRDTDEFVKEILRKKNGTRAFIGLFYQNETQTYHWGEPQPKWAPNQPIPLTYYGWNFFLFNSNKKGPVVTARNGWEHWSGYAWYICQVDAQMSAPMLECPSSFEGEKGHLQCSIDLDGELSWSAMSMISKSPAANCTGDMKCKADFGYDSSISTDLQNNRMIMSLDMDNVTANKGTWECVVQFKGHVKSVRRNCALLVYFAPEEPHCSYNLTDSSISVLCITDKVNPEAVCEWTYKYTRDVGETNLNDNSSGKVDNSVAKGYHGRTYHIADEDPSEEDEETSHYVSFKDNDIFYTTECKRQFRFFHFLSPGIHNISLTMFPNVPGQNLSQGTFAKTTHIVVNVTIPSEPPVFYRSDNSTIDWEYKVTENETLQIKCAVSGGSPPVYAASIFCDEEILGTNGQGLVTDLGQEVKMEITVTRKMHLGVCWCEALHLTSLYKLKKSIIFNVTFPPEVSPPVFNRRRYNADVTVESGQLVRAECFVIGNPIFSVSLYRIEKDQRHLLKRIHNNYLDDSFVAFCNASGVYACVALVIDYLNETTVETSASTVLKVRCQPQLCESVQPQMNIGLVVGENVSFTVCVLAYPAPNSFTLVTNGEKRVSLPTSRYFVTFMYTQEDESVGAVKINLLNPIAGDLGKYILKIGYENDGEHNGTNHTDILFNLVLKDPVVIGASSEDTDGLSVMDLITIIVPIVAVVILIIIITIVVIIIVKKKRARAELAEHMSYRLTDC